MEGNKFGYLDDSLGEEGRVNYSFVDIRCIKLGIVDAFKFEE